MITSVYEFKVDENERINPQFDRSSASVDLEPYQRLHIEIIGHYDSSLISINEVADIFEYKDYESYEWNFTKTEFVTPNVLIAIIHAS
jgi:hypothetical protein